MIANASHRAIGTRFGCESHPNRKTIARPVPSRPVPYIPLVDALVKVRSTLAESDKTASPIVKAVAREASTGGWRC